MRRHLPFVLLILLGLFAAYGSVVFARYAYSDDYPLLFEAATGGNWLIRLCASTGRAVLGVLLEYELGLAGTVENLRFVRLASVLLIAAVAMVMYRHLLFHSRSRMLAAAITLFLCTLTPFQVYSFWATSSPNPLAILLTYPAYRLLTGPFHWLRLLGAVVIMWIALNIYQSASMFIWFWFFSELILSPLTWKDLCRRLLRFVPSVALCVGVYAAVFKLIGLAHSRTAFKLDPLAKIKWFFVDVLPCTFRFHFIEAPPAAGVICLIVIVLAILLCSRHGLPKLALAAAVLPLSYLPNLIAAESWSTYRTQAALMAVAGMFLCYAIVVVLNRITRRPATVTWTALSLLAITGVIRAGFNVSHFVVQPQALEFKLARSQMRQYNPDKHSGVLLIQADWTCLLFGRYQGNRHFDEFATPSSLKPKEWGVASSMAWFAMHSVRPGFSPPPGTKQFFHVYSVYDKEPRPEDPKLLVVDMRRLKSFR